VVTVNGKPDAVLMDGAVFERKLKTLNLSALILEAEADILAGRTRPARSFLAELKHENKIFT